MKLWRYMPLSHYVLMVASSKLYVPNTMKLSDPLEGTWFSKMKNYFIELSLHPIRYTIDFAIKAETNSEAEFREYLRGLGSFYTDHLLQDSDPTKDFLLGKLSFEKFQKNQKEIRLVCESELGVLDGKFKNNEKHVTEIRKMSYVSSWSKNDEQNLALWKIFGHGDDTVAVTTTVEKLKRMVENNRTVLNDMGMRAQVEDVIYLDGIHRPNEATLTRMYEIDHSVGYANLGSLMVKPKPYFYENEVRLIVFPHIGASTPNTDFMEFDIRLKRLEYEEMFAEKDVFIDEVYLPPNLTKSSPQFKAVTEINEKFGLTPNMIKIDRIEIGNTSE